MFPQKAFTCGKIQGRERGLLQEGILLIEEVHLITGK